MASLMGMKNVIKAQIMMDAILQGKLRLIGLALGLEKAALLFALLFVETATFKLQKLVMMD